MFDDMTPEQLRAELAKFQKPDSGLPTPGANTQSADELRTAFILAKKTELTQDEKDFLRDGILSWNRENR